MSAGKPDRVGRPRVRTARLATREMVGAMHVDGTADSLVVIYATNPDEITRRIVLDAQRLRYSIGRSTQCDIVLESNAASRKHARIERQGGDWWLVDGGSMNGTYVNDRAVRVHKLEHGDRVQIGDTIFKHLSGDDVEAAFMEAIESALTTDGLTQAANERRFREQLQLAIQRAPIVSLIVADIDYFKSVNDTHGHPAGDRVLREFVRVVRGIVPDTVLLARVGGEEFALLCARSTSNEAIAVAESARGAVAAHAFATPAGTISLTASFGVATLTSGEEPDAFFARADQNLYAAKRGGRNRVVG